MDFSEKTPFIQTMCLSRFTTCEKKGTMRTFMGTLLDACSWRSPKASHIKANLPHFPHFLPRSSCPHFPRFPRFCLCGIPDPFFLWGERDLPHFPRFPRIGFESLISKPRGPKDQKISRFRARLKISSENEFSERAPTAALFFVGRSRRRD